MHREFFKTLNLFSHTTHLVPIPFVAIRPISCLFAFRDVNGTPERSSSRHPASASNALQRQIELKWDDEETIRPFGAGMGPNKF